MTTPRWIPLVMVGSYLRRLSRTLREESLVSFMGVLTTLTAAVVVVGRLPIDGYETIRTEPGAYAHGLAVGTDAFTTLPETRGLAGLVFTVGIIGVTLRQVQGGIVSTHYRLYLLTTTPTELTVSEWLKNTAYTAVFALPVLAASSLAFGIGVGSPLVAVTLLAAGVVLVATVGAVGLASAVGFQYAAAEHDRIADNRRLFGVLVTLAFASLFVEARESVRLLGTLPIGWYGDLGLLPVGGRVGNAAGAVAGSAMLAGSSLAVVRRLGPSVWLTDQPPASTPSEDSELTAGLDWIVSPPVAGVAISVWRRLYRKPRALLFAVAVVPLTVGSVATFVGDLPSVVPIVVGVYGGVLLGLTATVNVLGNEGRVLPLARTTPDGSRHVVYGYVLSAVLPGLLLVVPLVVGVSLFVGSSVGTFLSAVLVSVTLVVAGPAVAVPIGLRIPNYDGTDPVSAAGTNSGRLESVVLVMLTVSALAQPAVFGLFNGSAVASVTGLPTTLVAPLGVGLTVVAGAVLAWLSVRRGIDRLERYSLA